MQFTVFHVDAGFGGCPEDRKAPVCFIDVNDPEAPATVAENAASEMGFNVAEVDADAGLIFVDDYFGECEICGKNTVLPFVESVCVSGELDDTFRFCVDCVAKD